MQRIWSERVPYGELDGKTLQLLADFDLELVVAVTPRDLAGIGALAARLDRAGLKWVVWPMLENADGRWASCFNAAQYVELARNVTNESGARAVAIDLEPPYQALGSALRLEARALGDLVAVRRTWNQRKILSAFARELEAGGVHVTVAATPLAVAGIRRSRGWQKWLGAPVDDIAADRVDVMLYSSLFEGYSGGQLSRADARAILYVAATRVRQRFGEAAAVSLGVAGIGALGDERPYRSADELADDVAIARAAGIRQLSLFDLWGVLSRPEPETWLRAFTELSASQQRPPLTMMSALAAALPTAAGVVLRLL